MGTEAPDKDSRQSFHIKFLKVPAKGQQLKVP